MEIRVPQFDAVNGLNNIYQSVRSGASKIASEGALQGDIDQTTELVKIKQSELSFSSVAKVLKTENEILGTFLDKTI